MLPVPLNSSKITSSMRLPVSIKRGGDDGERAAFFDVSRGGEEAARALQRVRVNTARENFARRRRDGVIRAAQTRERIEQDHDIALVLDEALGFFEDHFRHLNVALRRFIERGADDFALYRALHVRDFFRTLVNQQHDQRDFRMIRGDGIGDATAASSFCRCAAARRSIRAGLCRWGKACRERAQ